MGGKHWTVDKIKFEASKYATRTEFARNSMAYHSARSKGILDEVCSHMEPARQSKYSLDVAKSAAALCKNQNEFKAKYPELHAFARRNNVMQIVCSGLSKKNVWSDDDLRSEAGMYQTLGDFKKGSPLAYASLNRKTKEVLKAEATRHMAPCRMSWSDEMLYVEALKYSTRIEFKTSSSGAYQAALLRGIADDICRHMPKVLSEWSEQTIRGEASQFSTRVEFLKSSPRAYSAARRVGILDDVCSHMAPVFTYWSVDTIRSEASKYQTRGAFATGASSAYQAAMRLRVLDDVCSHMTKAFQWDVEALVSVVNKCASLTELIKTRPEVYQALQSRGILRETTSHMPRGKHGFKPNLMSHFYVYKISMRHSDFIGFGVTNDMKTRHRTHVRSITRCGGAQELLFSYKIKGGLALELERALKRKLQIVDTGVKGFRTEAVAYNETNITLIMNELKNVYNDSDLAISKQTG